MEETTITKQHKVMQLNEVKEYKNNNKIHKENIDAIVRSIEENTYIANIIVDEDFVILAGHGRKKALQKMGVKEEEITIITGLTDKQKKKYRLKDNVLSEMSEWDIDNVNREMFDIDDKDLNDFFDIGVESKTEIKEEELQPYKKTHFLFSCDIDKSPQVIEFMNKVKDIDGITVLQSNN